MIVKVEKKRSNAFPSNDEFSVKNKLEVVTFPMDFISGQVHLQSYLW